ncbi:MAG TPA: hypothetical protein VF557_04220 [Jatrophihabitans sp.]
MPADLEGDETVSTNRSGVAAAAGDMAISKRGSDVGVRSSQ